MKICIQRKIHLHLFTNQSCNTMKTKQNLLIGLCILCLFSCSSSPLDLKFNEETGEEDLKEISHVLNSNDYNLLLGTIIRYQFQDVDIEGMTYAKLLEEGKLWKAEQDKIEAEQKALAEKARQEELERRKRLSQSIIVSCFEKGFYEDSWEDYITFKFIIQNKSENNIRAFKGSINFTNLFDDDIKSIGLTYENPIKAGDEIVYNAQINYNQFRDEDVRLKNADLENLKVIWNPQQIILEDGSLLE